MRRSVIGIPLFMMVATEWMHRGGILHAFIWMFNHPQAALLNYVIIFAITNVCLLVMRRKGYYVVASVLGFCLITIAYISFVKEDLRGEPLTILDINLINEAAAIAETFQIDTDRKSVV